MKTTKPKALAVVINSVSAAFLTLALSAQADLLPQYINITGFQPTSIEAGKSPTHAGWSVYVPAHSGHYLLNARWYLSTDDVVGNADDRLIGTLGPFEISDSPSTLTYYYDASNPQGVLGMTIPLDASGSYYVLLKLVDVIIPSNVYPSWDTRRHVTVIPSGPTPPIITTQPQNRTVDLGTTATFTVSVTGTLPLSYRWLFNNSPLTGATNATLVLSNVTTNQAGLYSVIVTNAYGTSTSSNATLTVVLPPPSITTQPASQTVVAGGTASFNVGAGGSLPLSYQWWFNGGPLAGATNATLVLSSVTTNQAGPYSVAVTNAFGDVTSSNALLTVIPVLTLGEAMDAPDLTWTTGGGGGRGWIGQTTVSYDGMDAAQSGVITDSQETWMQTSVTGPGSLSFWWKVSSQSGDYLEFYINGALQSGRIAGEVNWRHRAFSLGAGTQTLGWRYMKNASGNVGWDRAWVDDVRINPNAPTLAFPSRLANGQFQFQLNGPVGSNYVIRASTNLTLWLAIATNVMPAAGFILVTDPSATNYTQRFYRAVSQ